MKDGLNLLTSLLETVKYKKWCLGCELVNAIQHSTGNAWITGLSYFILNVHHFLQNQILTRMWANAQRDGRPAGYRWRPLFNAAKFRW